MYAGTYHPIDTSALLCLVLASSSDTQLIIVGQILNAVTVIQLVLINKLMLMWGFQLTVHINAHGIMHTEYLFQIYKVKN